MDPVAFEWGPITIRWYGLLFALGFLIGLQLMQRIYEREGKPVSDLSVLLVYVMIGTVVGARLGHVLFYAPGYYFSNPAEILKIWEGGLASHGGAIGVVIALFLYTRSRATQPFLWLLCRISIPTALAGAFIRLGNFFNSEILGVPTEVPWAVVFTRIDTVPRHPAQLYEAAAYLGVFVLLGIVYRRGAWVGRPGLLVGLFLTTVFGARFVIEFVKAQQAHFEMAVSLSVGQILSIPMIVVGILLLGKSFAASHADRTAGR